MLYKPVYCCNCGERIERIEWHLFTNRRFCELCETEHRVDDLIRRSAVGFMLLLGVFGFGSYLAYEPQVIEINNSGSTADSTGTLNQKSEFANNSEKPKKPENAKLSEQNMDAHPEVNLQNKDLASPQLKQSAKDLSQQPATKNRVQIVTSDPVHLCGALTKKGTPCSRRVKGGGRCWQHKGKKKLHSEK